MSVQDDSIVKAVFTAERKASLARGGSFVKEKDEGQKTKDEMNPP
jgi:hypothetical protein